MSGETMCGKCNVQMVKKARVLRQAMFRCPRCGVTRLVVKRERTTNRGGAK